MKTKNSKYLIPLIFIVVFLLAILLALLLWQYGSSKKVDDDLKVVEDDIKYVEEVLEENKVSPGLVAISDDIILPDINSSFEDIKEELSNPEVLVAFLNQHFDLNKDSRFIAQEPEEFFNNKSGNAVDLAVFSAQILYPKAPITSVIRYDYLNEEAEEKSNFVVVFRGSQSPKYISLNQLGEVKMYVYGRSYLDLIRNEERNLNIKVLSYAHFSRNNLDLSEVVEPFTWQLID